MRTHGGTADTAIGSYQDVVGFIGIPDSPGHSNDNNESKEEPKTELRNKVARPGTGCGE